MPSVSIFSTWFVWRRERPCFWTLIFHMPTYLAVGGGVLFDFVGVGVTMICWHNRVWVAAPSRSLPSPVPILLSVVVAARTVKTGD